MTKSELSTGINVCKWTQDEDETGTFETECGNRHSFIDGGIEDNSYVYCPYCGLHIEEVE